MQITRIKVRAMFGKQSGFTFVEMAIALVIIGLLFGGVLKEQKLVDSTKVKRFASDFHHVPLLVHGYKDKYKALPGDDTTVNGTANGRFGTSGTPCAPAVAGLCATGNGVIDGPFNADDIASETFVFWQHVRLAGFSAGSTAATDTAYAPTNADGGRLGVQSAVPIASMMGSSFVCSEGIQGKFAKQLDATLDDGNTATGSMRAALGPYSGAALAAVAPASIVDGTTYIVCLAL